MPDIPDLPQSDWTSQELETNFLSVLRVIQDHFDYIREVPVSTSVPAAEVMAKFDRDAPDAPEEFSQILADTKKLVIPHLTQWNHPSFHGYFSISAGLPGVLAETLSAALNINAMHWKSAPAASALESVVLRWMAKMVGYPEHADGVLVNGASLATLYALTVARDQLKGLQVRQQGIASAGRLRLYSTSQAHSSVDKAAITLGIGLDNIVRVHADDRYQMCPYDLGRAIRADINAGYVPVAAVATVGTTTVGAADPVAELADVCHRYGVWLHVDAAYGGFWKLVPDLADKLPAVSAGDSLVVNPHKVLYTPMEATALYCRRSDLLAKTFMLTPEYLRTEDEDVKTDYMDRSPQLGRSFRALKIWWVIRNYGVQGIRDRLTYSVELATQLREWVAQDPEWYCPTISAYPLICLRYQPSSMRSGNATDILSQNAQIDSINQRILAKVNSTGKTFLSHGVLDSGYVIRVSIGNIRTSLTDIKWLWDLLRSAAKESFDEIAAPHL